VYKKVKKLVKNIEKKLVFSYINIKLNLNITFKKFKKKKKNNIKNIKNKNFII